MHWSQLYQQALEEDQEKVLITVRRGPAQYFFVLQSDVSGATVRSPFPAREGNS